MKNKILLAIFIVCLAASIILAFIPPEEACKGNDDLENGCYIVAESPYAKIIGISNSYFGVIGFLVLILLTIAQMKNPTKHKKRFIMLGIIVCAAIALYFLYLQFFVIKALCPYCMVVDIGSILSLIALFYFRNHEK